MKCIFTSQFTHNFGNTLGLPLVPSISVPCNVFRSCHSTISIHKDTSLTTKYLRKMQMPTSLSGSTSDEFCMRIRHYHQSNKIKPDLTKLIHSSRNQLWSCSRSCFSNSRIPEQNKVVVVFTITWKLQRKLTFHFSTNWIRYGSFQQATLAVPCSPGSSPLIGL